MSLRSLGRTIGILTLPLVLGLARPQAGQAQDFSFYEIGARAASLGGSFTARADDASAIYYNPAGLAFLDGLRLKTSIAFGSRAMNVTRSDNGLTFPSHPSELRGDLYMAWKPARSVGVGLAAYSPYNFASLWPFNWGLGSTSISSRLNAQTLRSAVAVEPLRGLAVGASLDLVFLSVGWDHYLYFDLPDYALPETAKQVTSIQSLKGHGLGYSVAALWDVSRRLRIGARYQAAVPIALRGYNNFLLSYASNSVILPGPDTDFQLLSEIQGWFYTDQIVTGRLNLPREIACGAAVTPFKNLTLSFDLRWDEWSKFGQWEFRSVKEGSDLSPRLGVIYRQFYGIEPDYAVQGLALTLEDSKSIMAGLEYKAWKWFSFRAGFTRLDSAVADAGRTPLYPDPGFTIYSFGVGYEGPTFTIWDPDEVGSYLTIDFFARYAASRTVSASYDGFDLTYGARRFVVGAAVGFCF
ncbi:MAG: outer membrane protein transport protein [Candidatus Aminicenantes bacterium]|nr:outer membrane protein transport protein [Candidatus Aminicenantes bacterium]